MVLFKSSVIYWCLGSLVYHLSLGSSVFGYLIAFSTHEWVWVSSARPRFEHMLRVVFYIDADRHDSYLIWIVNAFSLISWPVNYDAAVTMHRFSNSLAESNVNLPVFTRFICWVWYVLCIDGFCWNNFNSKARYLTSSKVSSSWQFRIESNKCNDNFVTNIQ